MTATVSCLVSGKTNTYTLLMTVKLDPFPKHLFLSESGHASNFIYVDNKHKNNSYTTLTLRSISHFRSTSVRNLFENEKGFLDKKAVLSLKQPPENGMSATCQM